MLLDVWFARPALLEPARLEALAAWLTPAERDRRARFVTAELRREYLVTRALGRWALSRRFPDVAPAAWTFARTEHDRPYVVGRGDLDFNLSNTPDLVACAVDSARLGIDVEREDRADGVLEVAASCFSDVELAHLASLDEATRRRRAVEFWALKESYVKALGDGLSAPLRQITFVEHGGRWHVDGAPAWSFHLTHLHGHALAVATSGVRDVQILETALEP